MTGGRPSWPSTATRSSPWPATTGGRAAADAEIAVTVEDAWQHQGIGHRLARRLAACALDHGFERFIGTMLPDNRTAIGLLRRLSPDASVRFSDGTYSAVAPLSRAS